MVTIALFLIGLFFLLFVPPELSAFYFNMPVDLVYLFRIFTHMLSHANASHLLGNFVFGLPYLLYAEHKMKNASRFLRVYLLCGLVALVGQGLFEVILGWELGGAIGSSGAIFGMIAYALCAADDAWWVRVPAHAILALHIVSQGMAVYAIAHGAWSFVAYAAHFAGILCGMSCYHVPRINLYLGYLKSLPGRLGQKQKNRRRDHRKK